MNRKHRLKALEKKLNPAAKTIQAYLPDWLQDSNYKEPVANPGEKIIVPSGFLALDKDGSIYYES